jgi:hypothetical protein
MNAPEYDLGCALYSGGLFSTAKDMAIFLSSQFVDETEAGNGVLGTGSLRRMRTPQSVRRPPAHTSYGLGWAIVEIGGHDAIEHNGALLGYHAHVSAIPDLRLGVAALSNSKNFLWRPDACKELARGILVELADALRACGEAHRDPSAVELSDYSGRYALPGGIAHLDVADTADGLHVTLLEAPDFSEDFLLVGPHAFSFAVDPARQPMLYFEKGRGGAIASVTFLSYTFRKEAADR